MRECARNVSQRESAGVKLLLLASIRYSEQSAISLQNVINVINFIIYYT